MSELEIQTKDVPLKEFDLDFILENRWDVVLDRLTEDMDPWDIDIIKLANRYRKYISCMKDYNLKVPAKVILVCATLIRKKADIIFGNEIIEEEALDEFEENFEGEEKVDYFIPKLELPVKRTSKRRVTLDDLKDEFSKALEIEKSRKRRWKERKYGFGINLKKSDIEEKLNELMSKLKEKIGSGKSISFEKLLQEKNKKEVVENFVHLLHLETEDQIKCTQKKFLGEILIKLKKQLNGGA